MILAFRFSEPSHTAKVEYAAHIATIGVIAMKKYLLPLVSLGVFLMGTILVTGAVAQENGKKTLRVNGAAMASDQVDRWAKQFMEANPDIRIVVVGSSAGRGFQSLLDGNSEIAMMSRDIRAEERKKATDKGFKLVERPIGQAGIAVITHSRNPLTEVTVAQLKSIYTGEYDNWKQLGGPDEPVRCLTRRIPESGGAVFFHDTVVKGAPFGPKAVMTETWDAILKVCTTAQDLPIGIVPHTRNLNAVKVLAVKGDDKASSVLPKDENIKNHTYPISLTFSFVWNEASNDPAITKFADFCKSQGGESLTSSGSGTPN
jgi:phosphate transport system substrate-binding protein